MCAVQLTARHIALWELIRSPGGISDHVCVPGWGDTERDEIYSAEMSLHTYSVNGLAWLRLPDNSVCSPGADARTSLGHSSFPHHTLFLSSGDNSSFCCFILWKWIALSTSGFPRLWLLNASFLCKLVPHFLLALVPCRNELCFLCIVVFFFFEINKQ